MLLKILQSLLKNIYLIIVLCDVYNYSANSSIPEHVTLWYTNFILSMSIYQLYIYIHIYIY